MSTNGTPTGVMRFKMEVMKKDNSFTNVSPPNVRRICLEGIYANGDTIHLPGYIRYINEFGNEVLIDNITSTDSGVITIYAIEVIESFGINFIICIE